MKNASRAKAGFTLLEILVALAIISIVMLATLHGGGAATHNAEYLKMRTLAHWVAMNRAAELQLSLEWLPIGERKGETVMAEKKWYWSVYGKETDYPDMRQANIKIWEQDDRDSEPLATLDLYVGKPQ